MGTNLDFRQTPAIQMLRALVEAYDAVMAIDTRQIRSYGISQSEFDCLCWLGVAGEMRMCDLAERSLLTKSRVTQVIGLLEQKKLVRRQRSPESDREVLTTLTDEGQTLFEKVYPRHAEFTQAQFAAKLKPEEMQQLTGLLRKLAPKGD